MLCYAMLLLFAPLLRTSREVHTAIEYSMSPSTCSSTTYQVGMVGVQSNCGASGSSIGYEPIVPAFFLSIHSFLYLVAVASPSFNKPVGICPAPQLAMSFVSLQRLVGLA